MRTILAVATTTLLSMSAGSAWPGQPAYIDNRSNAAALVHSLYNAINRHEYVRAYSYFSPAPAETVDAYVKGYAKTARVDVLTGKAVAEGAAGSIYFDLPVAIRATAKDGSIKIYGGCYTLRLAEPTIQGVPFQPLHIEKGSLAPASGDLGAALPKSCGD